MNPRELPARTPTAIDRSAGLDEEGGGGACTFGGRLSVEEGDGIEESAVIGIREDDEASLQSTLKDEK